MCKSCWVLVGSRNEKENRQVSTKCTYSFSIPPLSKMKDTFQSLDDWQVTLVLYILSLINMDLREICRELQSLFRCVEHLVVTTFRLHMYTMMTTDFSDQIQTLCKV